MTTLRQLAQEARTAAWHLRSGGLRQLRSWRRRRVVRGASVGFRTEHPAGSVDFPVWPVSGRGARRGTLRVGVILDDFSKLAFSYEWDQVELTPDQWLNQVETPRTIDLLFVESAWHGNGDAWRYHLTGPEAPRPALIQLVDWCRAHGVPTVFWNKEDPVHYADFLDTARLFDHIWTTDVQRVPDYQRDLGHERIGVLPFAAQPAIHNPVRPHTGHQSRDIAFAGMYFGHKYPERRQQMDLLLGAADRVSSRMPLGLEIFSRYLGVDERYQFPQPLAARVVGSLTYERMLSAYRGYKVFLNVNSVVGSPSMCARRIFEITACGTPVLSTPSPALEKFFPVDEIPVVSEPQEAEWTMRALVNSSELRDRMVHRAQRRIWSHHTYGHRVDDLLASAGVGPVTPTRRPTVSALVSSNRPEQVEHVLRTIAGQREVTVELMYLAHGFEADNVKRRAKEMGIEDVTVLTAPSEVPLGSCLNMLVRASSGDVVAKMDDDDEYGPHYLSDQLHALHYSGADVVGKQAHHLYLEDLDLTMVRFPEREHRFTDFVMGPTIVTRRDLAAETPFRDVARGEDTGFLREVASAGGLIYSADRFNFVQIRHRAGSHTWQVGDAELLANGRVLVAGRPTNHVNI